MGGVKLTSHSTFGTNAGRSTAGYNSAETEQGPGILDKVKQMVGLAPAHDAVSF